jgi:uncharacterized protein YdeI (YjbR/CyaY-like superfamily)
MNPKVDLYLEQGCMRCPLGATPDCKVHSFTKELELLRSLMQDCGYTEELKWGVPCYTYNGKNVVLLSAFKEYAAVSFFKGSLLSDEHKLLVKPGENSQASRYLKFTDAKTIMQQQETIKTYLFEAIEIEKAGLKVEYNRNPEPIPEELQEKLNEDPFFKASFEDLTPGRQRGYILHFSQPKQAKTRISRIEKCTPDILKGIGLNDKYSSKK